MWNVNMQKVEVSEMKPSLYNLFLTLENGDFLVYNCLHDKVAVIDGETRAALADGSIEDEEIQNAMVQTGFLTGDDVDELKIVRSRRREAIARNYAQQVGISYVLTYQCNLACTYCYEQGIRSLGGMMDRNTIDTIIHFLTQRVESKPSLRRIVTRLYGGEPLLNWEGCVHILSETDRIAAEHSLQTHVSLITNSTLFQDFMWEVLSSHGMGKLQITLDGCVEDHNQRRITPQGKGTYTTIMESIGKALDAGIVPEIRVNLDEKNYKRVGLLFDDLKERGYGDVTIQVGIVSGLQMHCPSDRLNCLKPTLLSKVLPYVWEQAESRQFTLFEEPIGKPIYCQFDLLDFFVIDPFLDVYKCWDLIGMKEHRIGRLSGGTFLKEYPYFDVTSRDVTLFNGCRECDILPVCSGSCAARAYDCFGTYHAAGCYQERYLIEQRVRRHIQKKVGEKL